MTDYEKTAAARLGLFNLMMGAVAASFLPSLTAQQALEYMRTYHLSEGVGRAESLYTEVMEMHELS